jgi:hypothetical protein
VLRSEFVDHQVLRVSDLSLSGVFGAGRRIRIRSQVNRTVPSAWLLPGEARLAYTWTKTPRSMSSRGLRLGCSSVVRFLGACFGCCPLPLASRCRAALTLYRLSPSSKPPHQHVVPRTFPGRAFDLGTDPRLAAR